MDDKGATGDDEDATVSNGSPAASRSAASATTQSSADPTAASTSSSDIDRSQLFIENMDRRGTKRPAESDMDDLIDSDDEQKTAGDSDSSSSGSSSDGGRDPCAICLNKLRGEVATPENCTHTYCLDCIQAWAERQANPTCPQDRQPFSFVMARDWDDDSVPPRVVALKRKAAKPEDPDIAVITLEDENNTFCEVCGRCDREAELLLCDGCDLGYHLDCLEPPLQTVPVHEWYCDTCTAITAGAASSLPGGRAPRSVSSHRASSSRSSSSRRTAASNRATATRQRITDAERVVAEVVRRLLPRTQEVERVRERVRSIRQRKRTSRKKKKKKRRRRLEEEEEPGSSSTGMNSVPTFSHYVNGDDDVDAFFNDDPIADELLSRDREGARPLTVLEAADVYRNSQNNPRPSYCGRTEGIVAKVEASTSKEGGGSGGEGGAAAAGGGAGCDLLAGILGDQKVLLAKSRYVNLSEDRKLVVAEQHRQQANNNDDSEEESLFECMKRPLYSQRIVIEEEQARQEKKRKEEEDKKRREEERLRIAERDRILAEELEFRRKHEAEYGRSGHGSYSSYSSSGRSGQQHSRHHRSSDYHHRSRSPVRNSATNSPRSPLEAGAFSRSAGYHSGSGYRSRRDEHSSSRHSGYSSSSYRSSHDRSDRSNSSSSRHSSSGSSRDSSRNRSDNSSRHSSDSRSRSQERRSSRSREFSAWSHSYYSAHSAAQPLPKKEPEGVSSSDRVSTNMDNSRQQQQYSLHTMNLPRKLYPSKTVERTPLDDTMVSSLLTPLGEVRRNTELSADTAMPVTGYQTTSKNSNSIAASRLLSLFGSGDDDAGTAVDVDRPPSPAYPPPKTPSPLPDDPPVSPPLLDDPPTATRKTVDKSLIKSSKSRKCFDNNNGELKTKASPEADDCSSNRLGREDGATETDSRSLTGCDLTEDLTEKRKSHGRKSRWEDTSSFDSEKDQELNCKAAESKSESGVGESGEMKSDITGETAELGPKVGQPDALSLPRDLLKSKSEAISWSEGRRNDMASSAKDEQHDNTINIYNKPLGRAFITDKPHTTKTEAVEHHVQSESLLEKHSGSSAGPQSKGKHTKCLESESKSDPSKLLHKNERHRQSQVDDDERGHCADELRSPNSSTHHKEPAIKPCEDQSSTKPDEHKSIKLDEHQSTKPDKHKQSTKPDERQSTLKPDKHELLKPGNEHQSSTKLDKHKSSIKPDEHQSIKPDRHKSPMPGNEHQSLTKLDEHKSTKPEGHQSIKPDKYKFTKPPDEHQSSTKPDKHKLFKPDKHQSSINPDKHQLFKHDEHRSSTKYDKHKSSSKVDAHHSSNKSHADQPSIPNAKHHDSHTKAAFFATSSGEMLSIKHETKTKAKVDRNGDKDQNSECNASKAVHNSKKQHDKVSDAAKTESNKSLDKHHSSNKHKGSDTKSNDNRMKSSKSQKKANSSVDLQGCSLMDLFGDLDGFTDSSSSNTPFGTPRLTNPTTSSSKQQQRVNGSANGTSDAGPESGAKAGTAAVDEDEDVFDPSWSVKKAYKKSATLTPAFPSFTDDAPSSDGSNTKSIFDLSAPSRGLHNSGGGSRRSAVAPVTPSDAVDLDPIPVFSVVKKVQEADNLRDTLGKTKGVSRSSDAATMSRVAGNPAEEDVACKSSSSKHAHSDSDVKPASSHRSHPSTESKSRHSKDSRSSLAIIKTEPPKEKDSADEASAVSPAKYKSNSDMVGVTATAAHSGSESLGDEKLKLTDSTMVKAELSDSPKGMRCQDDLKKAVVPRTPPAPTNPSAGAAHPSAEADKAAAKKAAEESSASQLAALADTRLVTLDKAAVVTLIKSFLDPHYQSKAINKEQYKEIVAKCVRKVLGSDTAATGEVATSKLRPLVDGYVGVYRHRAKKMAGVTGKS